MRQTIGDDLEVLDVRRGMEMSGGLLGCKDLCVWEDEEVRAGVSGGSTVGLLPLWSMFEVTRTHEESAGCREGRAYRFGSQFD